MTLQKLKHFLLPQLFVIYTRYLIGGAFVFASIIKIKGQRFTSESGEDTPIHVLWHFFETLYQSGLYWQFIGWGQLIAGGLLMTQRYAKLGAVTFFPIMVNVFVITLSYDFSGTPVITGLMLLATLMLLVWEWDELRVLVNLPPVIDLTPRLEKQLVWQVMGLVLFLFTAGYRFIWVKYDIFVWAGVFFVLAIGGLVWGLWQHHHPRKSSLL
ncbi:MAG: hypothetical protein MUE30_16555 [Spirosomaceae bacterium]|nr:hypothetical protein [Spirosomataceae bacterium]